MSARTFRLLALALLPFSAAAAGQPLGTAVTYQGRLDDGGRPATGVFDFQFRLFDAATLGSQVGPAVCADNVSVAGGAFTLSLDFGPQFNGDQRFLEVEVRANTGLDCTTTAGFTTLSPRQPLSAAPYALKVPGVDGHSLDAADGSPSDAVFVNAEGRVGIGTPNPAGQLHVNGAILASQFEGDGSGLTGLNASAINQGVLSRFRLPPEAARRDLNNVFTGLSNVFEGRSIAQFGDAAAPPIPGPYAVGIGVSPSGNGTVLHVMHESAIVNTLVWPVRIENENQGSFQGGMRLTNDGFFEVTNAARHAVGTYSYARLSTSGSWTMVSDRSVKTDIEPEAGWLAKTMRLRPVSFRHRGVDAAVEAPKQIGFVAQEVEEVIPSLVTRPTEGYLSVDYAGMSVVAVGAIQELKAEKDAEIAALRAEKEAEIAELRARLEALEAVVHQAAAEAGQR